MQNEKHYLVKDIYCFIKMSFLQIATSKDAETKGDLDIVELSSIDHNLPGFQPPTYKGQKTIVEC